MLQRDWVLQVTLLCLPALGQGLGSPSERRPLVHSGHTQHGSAAPLPLARQKASWSLQAGREQRIPLVILVPFLRSRPWFRNFLRRAKFLSNLTPKFSRSKGSTSLLLPSSLPPSFSNAHPAAGAARAPQPSRTQAACPRRAAAAQKRMGGKGPVSPREQQTASSCQLPFFFNPYFNFSSRKRPGQAREIK